MIIDIKSIEKKIVSLGYHSIRDFLLRFFIPVVGTCMIVALIFAFFIKAVPIAFSILFMIVAVIIGFAYPFIQYYSAQQDIHTHLHYFITYAGTIATMKISRDILFKRISEKKIYGEISKIFEKTLYLAKSWNLGFAHACRKMGKRTPSRVLSDFFDRMAVIMDFGEEIDTFLFDEQKSILEDYSVEYQKSLEMIKLLQELYIALSISFAFITAIALLAPILMDYPIELLLVYALIGLILLNFFIIMSIRNFIPRDNLLTELKEKNEAQKKIKRWFYAAVVAFFVIFLVMLRFTPLNFITAMAIASLPFVYPGILANNEEQLVIKRDMQFPIFVRVFGSAVQVRNGGVISALKSIKVHDFGVINDLSVNLYRRLRVGADKFKSWGYFAIESGSNIISNFSRILYESIYMGGKAGKIGEIISNNVNHLISLRKLRWQLSGGMRGSIYGVFIGVSALMFVTAKVSEILIGIFTPSDEMAQEMTQLLQSFMPFEMNITFMGIFIMISVMVIVNAFASSIIIKSVYGGSMYSAAIDFVILIWIAAILAWIMPSLVESVIPEFETIWALE